MKILVELYHKLRCLKLSFVLPLLLLNFDQVHCFPVEINAFNFSALKFIALIK